MKRLLSYKSFYFKNLNKFEHHLTPTQVRRIILWMLENSTIGIRNDLKKKLFLVDNTISWRDKLKTQEADVCAHVDILVAPNKP